MPVIKNAPNTKPWIADVVAGLPSLCTIKEASSTLRMSPRGLRRHLSTGRIGSLKAVESGSSRVLIPRAEIGRYLESMART